MALLKMGRRGTAPVFGSGEFLLGNSLRLLYKIFKYKI